eukprot:7084244-Alexandrium_andersonii.AAC.1
MHLPATDGKAIDLDLNSSDGDGDLMADAGKAGGANLDKPDSPSADNGDDSANLDKPDSSAADNGDDLEDWIGGPL